ncbi:MAG TPA: hypothetical protein VJH92_00595 [Candidatus Nanoarchaeia archaeon]|nr:hypothetical protein [Candidatus Nanoarchaeia archaeon]
MRLKRIIQEYNGLLVDGIVCLIFAGISGGVGIAYGISEDNRIARSQGLARQEILQAQQDYIMETYDINGDRIIDTSESRQAVEQRYSR